ALFKFAVKQEAGMAAPLLAFALKSRTKESRAPEGCRNRASIRDHRLLWPDATLNGLRAELCRIENHVFNTLAFPGISDVQQFIRRLDDSRIRKLRSFFVLQHEGRVPFLSVL